MNSIVSLQGEILPHFSTEPLCLLPAYYPFNKNNSLFAKHSTAVYAAQGGNSVFLLINAQLSIYLFLIYSCELFLHIDVMLWDSEDKHNIWIPECQKDFNIVCSDSVDISFVCPSACFPQCNIRFLIYSTFFSLITSFIHGFPSFPLTKFSNYCGIIKSPILDDFYSRI